MRNPRVKKEQPKEEPVKVVIPSSTALETPTHSGPANPISSGSTIRDDVEMTMAGEDESDQETVVGGNFP